MSMTTPPSKAPRADRLKTDRQGSRNAHVHIRGVW